MLPIVHEFIHEIVVAGLLGIAGSAAMWPIKRVTKAYASFTGKLDGLSKELETQRTNHLTHIEASSEKQVEVLTKVASTLDAMHYDQARLLGRLEK